MEETAEPLFRVVVNHEEQYSVWAADLDVPAGWRPVGEPRPRKECLDHIAEVWTDMRPLSLRRAMDGEPPPAGADS
jgi:MbtH protein